MDYQFRKKILFVNPWQCPLVSSGVPSNSTVPEDMQALAVERGWRILWSTISDYLGRRLTYMVFFALETAAFWLLAEMMFNKGSRRKLWPAPIIYDGRGAASGEYLISIDTVK